MANELPLMFKDISAESESNYTQKINDQVTTDTQEKSAYNTNNLFEALRKSAKDPMAEGKALGAAFEENIAELFRYMGFDAVRIGGS